MFRRICAAIAACIMVFSFGFVYATDVATPTNIYEELVEFEDDDFGYIDRTLIERKVYIEIDQDAEFYGDPIRLIAILVDFEPEDNPRFQWQYSEDCEAWYDIADATKQTYEFIVDYVNVNYWYRVQVTI